jgi:hypothetical protein
VIPFCTIPFERSAARAGALDGGWRQDNAVLATLTGRPKVTFGVLAGIIIVIFVVMMLIGGPFS